MLATEDQLKAFLEIFKNGSELTYKKGEFIIRPGQAPTGVFYIKTGLVKAYDISKYGEENLLVIRKEREVFPLIWAITGQERHIIYEALSPTTVLTVPKDTFFNALRKTPDTLTPVMDMVVEMYRIHSERILNLEYRSVRERLISFLLMMSGRFGVQTNNKIVLNVPLRQQDIASSINATRKTTSREMTYLDRQGLIENKSSVITLLDVAKLKKFL